MEHSPKDKPFFTPFVVTKPKTDEPILTMVFANMQPITEVYTPDKALENGTLFKNLDKPFFGSDIPC